MMVFMVMAAVAITLCVAGFCAAAAAAGAVALFDVVIAQMVSICRRSRTRRSARAVVALRGCGAGRCAYCHDDVVVEDRAACAACLAVHHEECWEGRCAACGAAIALRLRGSSEASARPDAGPRGKRIARR
jgi:hypothetical protein